VNTQGNQGHTNNREITQKEEKFGQAVDIAGGRSRHYDFVDPVAQAVQEGIS